MSFGSRTFRHVVSLISVIAFGSVQFASGSALTELSRWSLERASLQGLRLEPDKAFGAFLADDARTERDAGLAGGKAYRMGWLETAPIPVSAFDRAVVSWGAVTPKGTWLRIEVRARVGGRWTASYPLALWSRDPGFWSRSFPPRGDADGRVNTDTLELTGQADAIRVRVQLASSSPGVSPKLTALAALTWDSRRRPTNPPDAASHPAWGVDLPVPQRSQMIYPETGPLKGGEVWCSPTSVTMVLEYWSVKLGASLADPVPVAARATWDRTYAGGGNWPFNTAYVASKGLHAVVTRFSGLAEAEAWIARGVPLVLSIGWNRGELDGAPLPTSRGHILVLRGFTPTGDPVFNDPAYPSAARVRTVYRRAQLERLWLGHSSGIAYLIRPPG